jgi:magnesium chelatase subunit D
VNDALQGDAGLQGLTEAPELATAHPWDDAVLAALLMAADPAGTGIVLRAAAGPVRDHWLALLQALLATRAQPTPVRRLPLHIRDERLLGGLDLPATLQAGRPVAQRGVLAEADGGVLLIAMGERLSSETAARLAAVIDRGEVHLERDGVALRHPARFGTVVFDEGSDDEERPPPALLERSALLLDLTAVTARRAQATEIASLCDAADIERASQRSVHLSDDLLQALCAAAAALGVHSPRAVLQALHVARAHAALCARDTVEAEDAAVAARLVLAPRATQAPVAPPADADESPAEPEQDQPAEAPPEPPPEPPADASEPPPPAPPVEPPTEAPPEDDPPPMDADALGEMMLQAALAALPPDLLLRLQAGQGDRNRARSAGRSGAMAKGGRRGRPVGARRGEPRGGLRLNVVETLRAAAPWQRLRRAASSSAVTSAAASVATSAAAETGPQPQRILVRADDFHVTPLRQRRETTTIFAVDASGSLALNRLAEAKGAVELLLADCYVRRDSVALLAFRGRNADVLLPPTRSLVRAKRCLSALPGGGGTPLAAALQATATLAEAVRRRGDTPLVVLLTDGRANVSLDGTGGRTQAEAEALDCARRLRLVGCAVLLIDTSPQPTPAAARLAEALHGRYLPLPYADANRLSMAVRAAAL